jgi:hypothetical protein
VPDDLSDFTPNDLDYDLEGERKIATLLQEFFGETPRRPVRTRGVSGGAGARPAVLKPTGGVGRQLVLNRCLSANQGRYSALVNHETSHDASDDYGLLIAAACVVLEAEFDHLLTSHAEPIADELIALLQPRSSARMLVEWRKRPTQATIATHCVVLEAMRCGLVRGQPVVCDLLRRYYHDDFQALLRSNGPQRCLDWIRYRYRNPAMHGFHADGTPAVFDADAYEAFVGLMVASTRFGVWDRDGPKSAPLAPDVGVFHHQLCHSQPAPRR